MRRIILLPLLVSADWVNKNIHRDIRVSQASLVETVTTFTVVPGPLNDYRPYTFYVDEYSNVGEFSVKVAGQETPIAPKLGLNNVASFEIPNLDSNGVNVTVKTVSGNLLLPLPASIRQLEKQFVLLNINLFVNSPHATENESTTITLPGGAILENMSHMDLVDTKTGRLQFSKKKIAQKKSSTSSNEIVSIHFSHPYPMAYIDRVSKTVDVSHWGSAVSVSEEIVLRNGGALLEGEFNRVPFTHMKFSKGDTPSPFHVENALIDIGAIIPFEAVNIHYRDVIGNISSSQARRVEDENVQFTYISLSPRFPLLGGWKTEFQFSYDLPASSGVLQMTDDDFYLVRVPISHAIPSLLARDEKISIILPTGAFEISVSSNRDVEVFDITDTLGWLEPGGKKKVSLWLGTMYVEPDNCLNEFLFVRYKIGSIFSIFKAPFLLSLYVFLFIVSILLYRRISFQIANPDEFKISDMLSYDYDVCKEIDDSLTDLRTMNGELLELTKTGSSEITSIREEYILQHKAIEECVKLQCEKFVSEKNKIDRTIRILMNLKSQKDAALLHLDAITAKKDSSVTAARLITAENEIDSLVSRVLGGQESPPPSPGGTPPSRSSPPGKSTTRRK